MKAADKDVCLHFIIEHMTMTSVSEITNFKFKLNEVRDQNDHSVFEIRLSVNELIHNFNLVIIL